MADTSILELENKEIDVKEYQKIQLKTVLNNTVMLKFYLYNNNQPVDLSQWNVEFRASLPKSKNIYSEVDNITKEGNLLTITCGDELTQEIGDVISYLRIFNNKSQQCSTYQIVIRVLSTINEDEQVATKSTLSALRSLDLAINKYLELKVDLYGGIQEANVKIKEINDAIANSKISKDNLNAVINNAYTIDKTLNTTIDNGNTTNTNIQNSITQGNTLKNGLDTSIQSGQNIKQALDISNTNAINTKVELNEGIVEAKVLLEDFKGFDTSQIVEKTSQMYNEMFPINELVTIEHQLNAFPLVQVIYSTAGYGNSTWGTSPYGGRSDCNLGTYKVKYVGKNKLKVIISNNYYKANPIVSKVNDYEYKITFSDTTDIINIKLLIVDNNSYLVDENGDYISDELGRYLIG